MSILNRRGKILHLRPGHLANFSGGAGYMPFVVIFSIPASLIYAIVASIFLHHNTKKILRRDTTGSSSDQSAKTLSEYVKYLKLHIITSAVIAFILAAGSFALALQMVYAADPSPYVPAALVLSAGPFAAWLASTYLLMKRTQSEGPSAFSLPRTIGFYFLFILATLVLGVMMLMMFTEVHC